MQYIEGPPRAIDRLYERIRADDRHRSIVTIHEEPVDARQFAGWSMAYAPTQAADFARLSRASRVGSSGTVDAAPALDAGRLLGDFWAQQARQRQAVSRVRPPALIPAARRGDSVAA